MAVSTAVSTPLCFSAAHNSENNRTDRSAAATAKGSGLSWGATDPDLHLGCVMGEGRMYNGTTDT